MFDDRPHLHVAVCLGDCGLGNAMPLKPNDPNVLED